MKGTLFSADFIKTATGDLKLLELNTDTGFLDAALPHLDMSGLTNVLSAQSITTVDVVYKPSIHDNIVDMISESLSSTGVTTFNRIKEDPQTIYPTSVDDAADKFILRLAYDEAAVLDSTYCKTKSDVFKLFADNSNANAVANYYISSSDYTADTLLRTVNADNIPDVAVKEIGISAGLDFYKVSGSGTVEENYTSFLNTLGTDKLISNYYNIDGDSNHKSLRSFNIVYGSDLDIINLGNLEIPAVLDKPTSISLDDQNKVDTKHLYEFATNFPFKRSNTYRGVFEEETITDLDGNSILVSNAVVGQPYQSYHIEGAPNTDNLIHISEWSHTGSIMPSGSYITSSVLVNSVEYPVVNNMISHITTAGSGSFRISVNHPLMVHNSNDTLSMFKDALVIDPATESLIGLNGELVNIASNEIEILDGNYSTYELDLEDTDTFILSDEGINVKIISHNACFPAGTAITLENGDDKNIEDLVIGDTLQSYDTHTNEFTVGRLSKISTSIAEGLIKIVAESGEILKSTPGHKIYCNKGWKLAKDLKTDDILMNMFGNETKIASIDTLEGEVEVYHLENVGNDHSYFANGLLVHNFSGLGLTCFIAGTKITMADSSYKNIEEIVIGDEVLSFDDNNQKVTGKVTGIDHSHTIGSHADACKTLGHGPSAYYLNGDTSLQFTPEHPFKVDMGWASLVPDPEQEPYKTDGFTRVLKLGDKIFDTEKNNWIEITSIDNVEYPEDKPVYNITVDTYHNYTAGNKVVHNK